ncbi:MAG: PD40 domain-containing protein [Kiritimatiellae bacterium]|nr:PD40 domain-containing protein [Kiritimatiellia bacterium]
MKIVLAFAAVCLAGTAPCGIEDSIRKIQDLSETSGAVFSPDGRRLAFEKQDGWSRHLGVCSLEDGRIEWIENGPGLAGMASWGADGSLVYIYGNREEHTAYEEFRDNIRTGYGIRIWRDGRKTDFTKGRRRDSTPAFSPDMKWLYYSSNEGVADRRLGQVWMWRAPVNDPGERKRIFFNQYHHIDACVNQVQPSPDGRFLAWAQLDCIQDRWSIRCARTENPDSNLPMTSSDIIAYEPRWSSDGRYLVYTGYREGDRSWSCYIQEVQSGAEVRICTGREPCLSPDMKWLVYTDFDAKSIRVRPMGRKDFMGGADLPRGRREAFYRVDAPSPAQRNEKVVFATDKESALPGSCAFADLDEPCFVRAKIRWSGDTTRLLQRALWAKYGPGSHDGINMIFYMGVPTLAICDSYDSDLLDRTMPEQTRMQIEMPRPLPRGTYVVTGIRTKNMVYLSVDGSVPLAKIPRSEHADLSKPERVVFGQSMGGAAEVLHVEFGTGWPTNVPPPPRRIDFWPRQGAKPGEARRDGMEKIALIDSFDFAPIFDIETEKGVEKIIDYAINEVGATSLLWRNQGGGVPRYDSREEYSRRRVAPFEKRIEGGIATIWSWVWEARYGMIQFALGKIKEKGSASGIHMTWEENHHQSASYSQWNLEHPEYSCMMRDSIARPGATSSLAYDEVLEHKLRRLDELLAMHPDTIYLDMWRQGGWYACCEYTPKMKKEWRETYGCEPPPASDDRWIRLVSKYVHRYLRAIRRRLDDSGRHVDFVLAIPYLDLRDRGVWERYAIDWKELAAEGVFDAISVMSVVPEKGREFESTGEIYRYVVAHKGRARKVYFPLAAYNFTYGLPSYARATGLSQEECAKRLLDIAKVSGGAGVTLECLDFDNYSDEIRRLLRSY